ncbi:hypothetical protein METBIDRAFT_10289 [Metschnikowia bicuspidata var. bicuspidata NRRL YB-4993]|uniref:beta-glucosidase n=1 Tax=Metschnikowia bicuspidata var. bicuspidata NRRL YB-4993 TaxID=869754 RepID=A0A1A0HIY5_9ASCO|nr:hypothetical protein METBIDRAFT_10289 [Metschnikowia bicuspidata var. bicuspidata NRRL YB-4993]OBA24119.1 hypothetical protein METBIDRAFT_10289 [Metschnikowia bicuspidata var. bicuspidata NRRL YB-4993]
MTAYNRVNGEHLSQSKKLLQKVLRQDWKWNGMVMSNWYGVYSMKESTDAGLYLEMPGPTRFRELVQTSHVVVWNEIHMEIIDGNVRHVLQFVNDCLGAKISKAQAESKSTDPAVSQLLINNAGESIVLLENEDNILPLSAEKTPGNEAIALLGPNFKAKRNSTGGPACFSARYTITPTKRPKGSECHIPCKCPGAQHRGLIEERSVATTKIVLSEYRTEKLPAGQQLFYVDFEGYYIPEETVEYQFGCSCLGTEQMFLDGELIVDNKTSKVKGDAFVMGMGTRKSAQKLSWEEAGRGGTRVFWNRGQVHRAGSFGRGRDGPKKADKVVLVTGLSKEHESEGYYEKIGTHPSYAFGHGFSYTTFELGVPDIILGEDDVRVSVKVTNTGKVAGDEVVHFYVELTSPNIIRPKKELKDFAKSKWALGESKVVSVKLPTLDVTSYWNSYKNKGHLQSDCGYVFQQDHRPCTLTLSDYWDWDVS